MTPRAGRGRRFLVAQSFGKVRFERDRGSWLVDVRPFGRIRTLPIAGVRPLPLSTRELADGVLAAIRAEIAGGLSAEVAVAPYLPRSSTTIGRKAEAWLAMLQRRVEAGERSPTYTASLERFAKPAGAFGFLWEISVYDLTPGDLEDWVAWLADRGVGQNTRPKIVGALRSLLGWLERRGELDRIPRFPELRKRRHVPRVISVGDQEAVLEEIPEARRGAFYAAVELLARPGEIRALDVSSYSWRDRRLTIDHAMQGPNTSAPRRGTKTGDVRILEASDRLADWLERFVPAVERLIGDRPLFLNPTGRSARGRWLAGALRQQWDRAATRAGFHGVRMYEGTKHSTATALRRDGVPLDVIRAAAGHADARSTELYAKLADQAVVEALRRRR